MIEQDCATMVEPKDRKISDVQEKAREVEAQVSLIQGKMNRIYQTLFGPDPPGGTDEAKKPQPSGIFGEIWDTEAMTSRKLKVIATRLDRICGVLNRVADERGNGC